MARTIAVLVLAASFIVAAQAAAPKPKNLGGFDIGSIPGPSNAPATPGGVAKIKNSKLRAYYKGRLRDLDAFLVSHQQLVRLRDRLWYIGFHNRSGATPAQVAGLVWCASYSPDPCQVSGGILK